MSDDGRTLRARRQREARQRQILDAGLRVFARKGFHQASVSDIVDEASVARGTFYLYFPSKQALFETLLDELIAVVEQGIRRVDISPGAPPPVAQLRHNVLWLLSLPQTRPELLQVLLWEAIGVHAATDAKLDSMHQRMFTLTQRSLQTGMAMGLVRTCDPELTARMVVGMVKEILLSLRVREDLEAADLEALADELLTFAARGLLRLDGPSSHAPSVR